MTCPIAQYPGPKHSRWLRPPRFAGLVTCLLLGSLLPWARSDDSPLALTDLADYRRALVARDEEPTPALIHFRELWDHPAKYAGTRIQVEGRIVRRFRQGAFGTFPPLVEAWAVTPSGDPFCWVYPALKEKAPTPSPAVQENVRFVGTYLKRIRYQGADVERLAPLIVGPHSPTSPHRAARPPVVRSGTTVNDWLLGLTVAVVAIAIIAWQHLKKPVPRMSSREWGADPVFDSPPSENPVQDGSNDER